MARIYGKKVVDMKVIYWPKLNGEGQIICDNGYEAKGLFKDDFLNGRFESWENGTINQVI